jgi:3-hydroxyacyl-[acyl-carrier-protein] dehydratase
MSGSVVSARESVLSTSVVVDPADPVFAGHYPGFPILPGLFLLQYVHDLVRGEGFRVTGVDRARFLAPVHPGAELTIEARLTEAGGTASCAAKVSVPSGAVAEIRLRCSPVAVT